MPGSDSTGEERLDLAIRLGRLADSSKIAHRLCDSVNVVAASPEYLRRHGRPAKPADLERHDCLPYPVQGHAPRWRFRAASGLITDVPVLGRVVVSNGVALRQCAVGGMGVLMLPRWSIADALRRRELVELFSDYRVTASEFDTAVWMIYPSRNYLPLKVRVLSDYLKEKFAHRVPAETGMVIDGVARSKREAAPRSSAARR